MLFEKKMKKFLGKDNISTPSSIGAKVGAKYDLIDYIFLGIKLLWYPVCFIFILSILFCIMSIM